MIIIKQSLLVMVNNAFVFIFFQAEEVIKVSYDSEHSIYRELCDLMQQCQVESGRVSCWYCQNPRLHNINYSHIFIVTGCWVCSFLKNTNYTCFVWKLIHVQIIQISVCGVGCIQTGLSLHPLKFQSLTRRLENIGLKHWRQTSWKKGSKNLSPLLCAMTNLSTQFEGAGRDK